MIGGRAGDIGRPVDLLASAGTSDSGGTWRARNRVGLVGVLTAPARHGLIRLRVDSTEHLPAEGPVILLANHLSFFDSVLLMFGLPRPVGIVGTDRVLLTGSRIVRPFRQAAIMLVKPIDAQQLGYTKGTNLERREVTDQFMAEIARLCAEDYVDSYAPMSV